MATMNVSLPDRMKAWVERQAASGRYANASDYIRDLIRRDEERQTAIAEMQAEIDIGLASGISELTPEQVFAQARERGRLALERRDGVSNVAGGGRGHRKAG
jgi:antitoxin ParD1/3/4